MKTRKRESPAVEDGRLHQESDDPQKKSARRECSVDGCKNQAAGGGICIRHGGKRIFKTCSLMKAAATKSSEEEFAQGTGQRAKLAVMMDASITPLKEESAFNMVQSAKYVAMRGAQTIQCREGSVEDMGQRPKLAVMKNAPTSSSGAVSA